MDALQLTLTVDDVNLILKALGRLPFDEVSELIANLRAQAEREIHQTEPGAPGRAS